MQQRFLLQILLLAQHVSDTTMPIIRSSRVLYSGCCLWYFVLWFSSCWSGVELRVMCPVCRMLQHLANRKHEFNSCIIFNVCYCFIYFYLMLRLRGISSLSYYYNYLFKFGFVDFIVIFNLIMLKFVLSFLFSLF